MSIRFLFYRANQERWNWIGHAIAAWTAILPCNWGRNWKYWYSHVELWFPHEQDGFGDRFCWLGDCFSSTTRGDAEGTRFIKACKLLKHPERWVYIEVECDNVQEVYDWCKTQVGRKYDYLGLFGFFLPFNVQCNKWWYCSEIIARAANLAKRLGKLILKLFKRISPRRLASKLAKKYGEPVRLSVAKSK